MSQFVTAEMCRLSVAGTHEQLPKVLEKASQLRSIHIVDHSGDDGSFTIGKPLEGADEVSTLLTKIRGAISQLHPSTNQQPISSSKVDKELEGDFSEKVDSVLKMAHECDDTRNEISSLEENLKGLKAVAPIGLDLELLGGYEHLSSFIGEVGNVRKTRDSLKGEVLFFGSDSGAVAIFCRSGDEESVQKALSENEFKTITTPEGKGNPNKEIESSLKQIKELESKVSSLEEEMANWSEKNGRLLLAAEERLSSQFEVLSAPVRVATTEHAFLLDAWVKSDDAESVVTTLSKIASHVEVEDYQPSHHHGHGHDENHEEPPIAFNDRNVSKPYELLTDLVGRPGYGKVDPTFFMFITYPIFFGMMLGDMGYGLMTVGLAMLLKSKIGHTDSGKLASSLIMYIGLSTMLFGFLYAEIWGFEIGATGDHAPPVWLAWMDVFYHWAHHPHVTLPFNVELAFPFHRVGSNMVDLILISIYFGVLHIAVGFLIGWRDVTKLHGAAAGFFEKGSWLLVLFGGFAAIYGVFAAKGHTSEGYLELLDTMKNVGGIVALVGLVCVCWGLVKYEGFGAAGWMIGVLEIVSLLSNTLSYVRLFAIGVVGVKIAETGNKLGYHNFEHALHELTAGHDPVLNIVLIIGTLALWLGVQIFAWVLGVFSPNIHTARLHFVEWMGKFYEGSGEPFNPFGGSDQYVEP